MPKPLRPEHAAPTPAARPADRSTQPVAWSLALLCCAGVIACGGAQQPAKAPNAPPLPVDIVAKAALPLYALRSSERGEEKLTEPVLWQELARAHAVCLGEQHDSPAHHFAQRRALEEIAARSISERRVFAVGFEMFQRPYQAALSGFVGGTLPEAQFLTDSEYKERWGFDFSLYRPLLDAAREFSLQALALNAPKELTRKVGRTGLGSLDAGEKQYLPELDLGNADHKAYFDAAMGEHPMPAGGPKLENMYAAQVLWDETMAETASTWLAHAGASSRLMVFAGAGHCHKTAIPARITRRVQFPVLSVTPVLASELPTFKDRNRYDWLIVLQDSK
ncbi:MAG: ChaN family lipoprotein [Deltaproteobacteria bacterium]